MNLPIVILAGGFGTRLGNLTQNIPKSLIPICGRPFIDWQIECIRDTGVTDFLVCIGHLGDQISNHLGDGKKFGVNIEFSSDGPTKLGTGGAILAAISKLPDNFMITYGDSYLPTNFRKIGNHFLGIKARALMTICDNKENFEKSNCYFKDGLIQLYSKNDSSKEMDYIDYGLSILNKSVFESRRVNSSFDLADLFEELSISSNLIGYEIQERYYEVGSVQGIKNLENYLVETGRS
jgi:NDP-sugar pyrophosphorylase family protein